MCECCQCDPCDCHGVNDAKQQNGQFWRVGTAQPNGPRQNHNMVGRSNTRQPHHGNKVAIRCRAAYKKLFVHMFGHRRIAGRPNAGGVAGGIVAFGGTV